MPKLAFKGGRPVREIPMPPFQLLDDEEAEAVLRVLRSQNRAVMAGRETESFEKEFADDLGVEYAVALSSGMTALHVALAAAGVGPGDEVIVPAYALPAEAASVVMQNAVPVFADIEPRVLGMDLRSAEKRITECAKALILAHANGYPMEMAGFIALAAERKLSVIEDCSHSHGASCNGRKVGTLGQIGIFCFQQVQVGEGGMLVTDDDALAQRAREIRSFNDEPLFCNYQMSELHAAVGRLRLKRLEEHNDARRRNADYLHRHLDGLPGIATQKPLPSTKSVYDSFILRLDAAALGVNKHLFIKALLAEGIPCGPGYYPLNRQRIFRERNAYGKGCPFSCPLRAKTADRWPDYSEGSCPVTEKLCDDVLIELKVHPPAQAKDMEDISTAVRKVAENVGELKG